MSRVAVVGLLVLALLAGAVVVDVGASSADDGDSYSLDELRQAGTHPEDAPDSVRMLDDGSGAVAVRYEPVNPVTGGEWEYLEPGGTLRASGVELYTTRFGSSLESQDATLVVVYWQEGTETVETENGTVTRPAAVDQTVERKSITLERGYQETEIDLRPHYDGTRQVTMWIETDGEPVEGMRWQFEQRTIPTSQATGFTTWGGLLSWLFKYILVPAGLGILMAFRYGTRVLNKTGRGPGLGLKGWGILGGVGLFAVASWMWWQSAVILTRLPFVLGGFIALVAGVAYLEVGGKDLKRVAFRRDVLDDAVSPTGEESQGILYTETDVYGYVDTERGIMPVRGGPIAFIARYLGRAPTLNLEDLETRLENKGNAFDLELVTDPVADEAVHYEPPRLTWRSLRRETDEDGLAGLLAGVRWQRVAMVGGAALVGYTASARLLGLTGVGILLGALVAVLAMLRADSGSLEFQPAPYHYLQARAVVTEGAVQRDDAKTIEDLEEMAWKAEATTALEARDVGTRMDRTITEQMHRDELGLDDEDDSRSRGSGSTDDRRDGSDDVDESEETSMVVRDD